VLPDLKHEAPLRNQRGFLVRPKLQKRSALKFAGRTIPEAKRSGISDTFKKIAQKRSALKFAGRTIPEAKRSGISDTFKKIAQKRSALKFAGRTIP